MGAWSYEPFGNDDAGDWLSELEQSKDLSVVEAALNAVTDDAEEYLQAPQCSMALAAAEVVAALLGRSSTSLPAEAVGWTSGKSRPSASLIAKAKRAVSAVLETSELQELWAESEDYPQWQAGTKNLLARLNSA
jgi:Domain of unknown function (DUF4259)